MAKFFFHRTVCSTLGPKQHPSIFPLLLQKSGFLPITLPSFVRKQDREKKSDQKM